MGGDSVVNIEVMVFEGKENQRLSKYQVNFETLMQTNLDTNHQRHVFRGYWPRKNGFGPAAERV
jgi:hypothetical protein